MRLNLHTLLPFILFLFVAGHQLFGMNVSEGVLPKSFDSQVIENALHEFDNHECFRDVKRFPVIFGSQQEIQTFRTKQTVKKTIYFAETIKQIDKIEELFLNDSYGQEIKSQGLEEIKTEYRTFLDSTAKTIKSVDPLLQYWISITKQPKDRLLDFNTFFDDFTVKHQLFTLSDFQILQASFPQLESQHVPVEKNSLLISHVFPWLKEHGPRLIEWHELNTKGSPLLHEILNSYPCFVTKKDEYQQTNLYPALLARDLKAHNELYGITSNDFLDFDKRNDAGHIKSFFEKLALNIQAKEEILDTFQASFDQSFIFSKRGTWETPAYYWSIVFKQQLYEAYATYKFVNQFFTKQTDIVPADGDDRDPSFQEIINRVVIFNSCKYDILSANNCFFLWCNRNKTQNAQSVTKKKLIFNKVLRRLQENFAFFNRNVKKYFPFLLNEKPIFNYPLLLENIQEEIRWAKQSVPEQEPIALDIDLEIIEKYNYEELFDFLLSSRIKQILLERNKFLNDLQNEQSYTRRIFPKLSELLIKLLPSVQTSYNKVDRFNHACFLAISNFIMLQSSGQSKHDVIKKLINEIKQIIPRLLDRADSSLLKCDPKHLTIFERMFSWYKQQRGVFSELGEWYSVLYPEIAQINQSIDTFDLFSEDIDSKLHQIFQLFDQLKAKIIASDESFFNRKLKLLRDTFNNLPWIKLENGKLDFLDKEFFANPTNIIEELEKKTLFFSINYDDPAIKGLKEAIDKCCKEVLLIDHILPLMPQILRFFSYNRHLGSIFCEQNFDREIDDFCEQKFDREIDEAVDFANIAKKHPFSLLSESMADLKKELEFYNGFFNLQRPCVFHLQASPEQFEQDVKKLNRYYKTFRENLVKMKDFNTKILNIIEPQVKERVVHYRECKMFTNLLPVVLEYIDQSSEDNMAKGALALDQIVNSFSGKYTLAAEKKSIIETIKKCNWPNFARLKKIAKIEQEIANIKENGKFFSLSEFARLKKIAKIEQEIAKTKKYIKILFLSTILGLICTQSIFPLHLTFYKWRQIFYHE